MADPATLQKELIDTLNKLQKSIDKMNTGASALGRQTNKASPNADNVQTSLEKLNRVIKKTNEEHTKAISSVQAIGKGIRSLVSDILPSSKAFKKIIDDTNFEFTKVIKNAKDQSGNYEMLSRKTFDFIKSQSHATTTIRNSVLAQKQYNDILLKSSKNQNKLSANDFAELSRSLESMTDLQKNGIDVFRGLTQHQINYLAKSKLQSKDRQLTDQEFKRLNDILAVVNKNFSAIAATTPIAMNAVKSYNKSMIEAGKQLIGSMKAVVVQAVPVIYKDLLSQARNAIKESQYTSALRMGVSQSELSDFIGKNRLALRTIGGGKAQSPIDDGQVLSMQKKAQMFGLTGAEGLKFAGDTMTNLINVGMRPSVENVNKQMDMMYKTMQQTGMTFDELNSVVGDLSQSPAFLSLIRATGYDNQDVQTNALLKLVTSNGYTSAYLKEMLEIEKNKKYQGIEDLVKSQIGVKLAAGQINRMLGRESIDPQQLKLLELGATRDRGSLQKMFSQRALGDLQVGGQSVYDKFKGANGASDFSDYVERQRMIFNAQREEAQSNAGMSSNLYGGAISKTILQNFLGMAGGAYNEVDQTLSAEGKRHAMFGSGMVAGEEQRNVLMGSKEVLIKSIDDVNNAFTKFNSKLLDTQQILSGVQANPMGGAGFNTAKNILSMGGDVASMIMMGKMMKGAPGGIIGGGGISKMLGMGGIAAGGGGILSKIFGGAGDTVAKEAGEGVAKTGAKMGGKALGKSLLKKIPIIGLLAGLGFGIQRALSGDFAGAGMEVASGGASLLPGFGTAASVAIDASLAGRDVYKAVNDTKTDGMAAEAAIPSNAPNLPSAQGTDPAVPTLNELMMQNISKMQELVDTQKAYYDSYLTNTKENQEMIKEMNNKNNQKLGREANFRFSSINP